MYKIVIGILLAVVLALVWNNVTIKRKLHTEQLSNEVYANDKIVLQSKVNNSNKLINVLRGRDSLHVIETNEMRVKLNEISTDENIKTKYIPVITYINNAHWNELDSILTAEGIIE